MSDGLVMFFAAYTQLHQLPLSKTTHGLHFQENSNIPNNHTAFFVSKND